MPLKLSMFVANYNEQKNIPRCLNSILNQAYSNFEVFFVDDCSMDDSLNVAREVVKSDSRFKIIEKDKNKGVFDSFEIFLNCFKGDCIAALGSDDLILDSSYFGDAVEALDAFPESGGFFGRTVFLHEENSKISGVMGNAPQVGFINKYAARVGFFSTTLFIPGHSFVIPRSMESRYGINFAELGPQQDFFANHLYAMNHGVIFSEKAYTCMNIKPDNKNFSSAGNLWEMTDRLKMVEDKFRIMMDFCPQMELLLPKWRAWWTLDAIRKTGVKI